MMYGDSNGGLAVVFSIVCVMGVLLLAGIGLAVMIDNGSSKTVDSLTAYNLSGAAKTDAQANLEGIRYEHNETMFMLYTTALMAFGGNGTAALIVLSMAAGAAVATAVIMWLRK